MSESWRAWLSDDASRVGPWWAGLGWTLVLATVCAIGFTLFSIALGAVGGDSDPSQWPFLFRVDMIISLSITLAVRLMFAIGAALIGRKRLFAWSKARRSIYYLVVPITGTVIGWPLGMYWALGLDVREQFSLARPGTFFAGIALAVLTAVVFVQFFMTKAQQIRAENQATEAQLRLLQAQIEPHFLFNTLANVVSLMDSDVARAKAMLESFVDYLRASVTGFRHGTHTLGDEIDLVLAYMRIVKMRMEDRLQYVVDVPAALRPHALPPLTLQPLVENAIVHGLEPQIAGGTIRIAAMLERGSLVLTVEDDGAGIDNGAAGGATPARHRARQHPRPPRPALRRPPRPFNSTQSLRTASGLASSLPS